MDIIVLDDSSNENDTTESLNSSSRCSSSSSIIEIPVDRPAFSMMNPIVNAAPVPPVINPDVNAPLIGHANFLQGWKRSDSPNRFKGFFSPPPKNDDEVSVINNNTDDDSVNQEEELDMEDLEKLADDLTPGDAMLERALDKVKLPEFLWIKKKPKAEIYHDLEYATINSILNNLSSDFDFGEITNVLPEDFIAAAGGRDQAFVDVMYYVLERRHENRFNEVLETIYQGLRKAGATEEDLSKIDKNLEDLAAKDSRMEVEVLPISSKVKREYWDQAMKELEQSRGEYPDEEEDESDEEDDDYIYLDDTEEEEEGASNENTNEHGNNEELSKDKAASEVIDVDMEAQNEEAPSAEISEEEEETASEESDDPELDSYIEELSKGKPVPELIDLADDDDCILID